MRQNRDDSTQKVEAVQGAQENPFDELKKVTPCNRCGAIGHWEEDCSQVARKPQEEIPSAKSKGKSRRFRREKSDGKGRGGSSNYPIVEVYNDGSKTQTSHMKVPPDTRFWIVVLPRVCVERNLSL